VAELANALRLQFLKRFAVHHSIHLGDLNMAKEPHTAHVHDRYDVLVVDNYEDSQGAERSAWTRVGVAFPHKDGDGMNVELQAIPVSGKLVIRRHEAKPKAQ
jgi:hypothetical protein